MSDTYSFNPPRVLRNPHLQTLLSYAIKRSGHLQSTLDLMTLEDGDKIALEISTPTNWEKSAPTVLLMHGIGGSSQSPYLKRVASKLKSKNIQTVRLNFRGIGKGLGLAKKISHGGSSQDIYETILYLKSKYPQSPLTVVGFSLSGNMLLKLAGERSFINEIEKVIAICPAIDLATSSKRMNRWDNRIYKNSILSSLIEIVESKNSNFLYKSQKPLKECKSLWDFDNYFTAPASGFKSVTDYYQKSSAYSLISKIKNKTHLLFAQDDPLVSSSKIKEISLPTNIELVLTQYGGHMGFINGLFKSDPFWMDHLLMHWILKKE